MAPKRKRAGSSAVNGAGESSTHAGVRDTSGHDSAHSMPGEAQERKSMDPPAKRTRASSAATNGTTSTALSSKKTEKKSELHIETGGKVALPALGAPKGAGENGEAGMMSMEAPPQAGLVDPAGGYKTNPPPKGRPVRVYADGVFDLFHLGHARQLQQAKTAFPNTYLIVGVTGDVETHKRKGLTVMSAKQRAESLKHCRWVDEIIEDCPWVINMEFLKQHRIDYVAHDDIPYGASEGDDIYKPIKEKGMFLVTQRTEGVSTTGIITKIVRDYEQYVKRQLKRGTSRQELNISWLKKNELDIKRHVGELRDTIRNNWTTTGQELSKEFRQFWQPSRPSSPSASLRNGAPGPFSAANGAGGLTSPSPLARVETAGSRSGTPSRGRNSDFAAGYAMGLIGGVKGWMEGSKRRNLADSRGQSPEDSPEERSPIERSPLDPESEAEGSSRGRSNGRVAAA